MEHTFVICAYKESPYIEECIRSLKKQTCPSRLLLSTATPSGYLEGLCERYGIAYYVRNGKASISEDWNYALSLASTPYVTIAHQDDLYEPTYTETIMQAAQQACEEGRSPLFVFTDYWELLGTNKYANRRNLKVKKLLLNPLKRKQRQGKRFWKRHVLRFGNAISCPTVTYHKRYLDKILQREQRSALFAKHFRSNLDWQTWEWLSRREGSFVYVPTCLMAHRIHEGSETSAVIYDNRRRQEDYEMFCKFWPRWIAKCITGLYRESEKDNKVTIK